MAVDNSPRRAATAPIDEVPDCLRVAEQWKHGVAPDAVVLLDRAGRLLQPFTPRLWAASDDQPRRWLLDGWEALANSAKYLHRGSLLEACEQVGRARERICQLWAVGEGVAYPSFGLTSLLDSADATLPPRLDATYPMPTRPNVYAASVAAAELLYQAGQHAQAGLDSPLRQYVISRLNDPRG